MGIRSRDWALPALVCALLLAAAVWIVYEHETEPVRALVFLAMVACAGVFGLWSVRNYKQARIEDQAWEKRLKAEAGAVTWQSKLADSLVQLARVDPGLAEIMRIYLRPELILEPARSGRPRRITLSGTRVTLEFIDYCFGQSTGKSWLSERNYFSDGAYKFDDRHEVQDRDQYRELTAWLERQGYIWTLREGRPKEWRYPWNVELARKAFFGHVAEADLERVREGAILTPDDVRDLVLQILEEQNGKANL